MLWLSRYRKEYHSRNLVYRHCSSARLDQLNFILMLKSRRSRPLERWDLMSYFTLASRHSFLRDSISMPFNLCVSIFLSFCSTSVWLRFSGEVFLVRFSMCTRVVVSDFSLVEDSLLMLGC